uniref:Uncharacterized protein n=1 Tax=Amphimedon queenslandica TaxID=400682 RepID=A0A1X7VGR9_AMPQE
MPNFEEELFNCTLISAILGTTIYLYSLTLLLLAGLDMEPNTNTPALYLKHVGTNHFQADKSIDIS